MSNKIYTIVGNRPQFVKVDKKMPNQYLIHTGAHYDYEMSQSFFKELKLPKPYLNLECKSSNAGLIYDKLFKLFKKDQPALVIVYGDTISTLMGALAAYYAKIPFAHIEAGARSGDMSMPEEANRIIVDRLAKVRFCFTLTCLRNLTNEKLTTHTHYLRGDPMFDAMNAFLPIERSKNYRKYILVTIHRDFNADSEIRLTSIFDAFRKTPDIKYIIPLHPRTKKNLNRFKIKVPRNIKILKPVGYKQMLSLESNANKIITDSGGIQREAYWFRIPCITLRRETEWEETVKTGWAILVDANTEAIIDSVKNFYPESKKRQMDLPVYGVNDKIREIISKYL